MIALVMIILFIGVCYATFQAMKDAHNDRFKK